MNCSLIKSYANTFGQQKHRDHPTGLACVPLSLLFFFPRCTLRMYTRLFYGKAVITHHKDSMRRLHIPSPELGQRATVLNYQVETAFLY